MNYLLRFSMIVFSLLLTLNPIAYSESPTQNATWNKKMQDLYQSLTELMVDISSDQKFNSPSNFKRIENNAKTFADLAHDISAITRDGKTKNGETIESPDSDPSIPMIASLFADDTRRAYEALKSNHRAYARTILKTVSGYCVGCHTRNNKGPDFAKLAEKPEVKSLTKLEHAEFMAATRQTEKALSEFDNIISDSKTIKERPIEWEKAVRYAMAISVRVKKDPDQALKFADKILNTKEAPTFIRDDAAIWKASIQDWKKEMSRKLMTEEGLYAEALRLINKAKEVQTFPADRAGDIYFLRVSALVHDMLRMAPDGPNAANGLLLLGISYEALRDLNLWSLHEFFYESCVRKAPHTDVAKTCYKHYEQAMYHGYSGSGGLAIPKDVKVKLKELESIASPEMKSPQ